jgi:hypothetical protein
MLKTKGENNMKLVTFDEVDAIVKAEIAAEGKDFVYGRHDTTPFTPGPACMYAVDGKADCIVGRVLAKLGVPVESMQYVEDTNAENRYAVGTADVVIDHLREDGLLNFDAKAITFLTILQSNQDNQETWGDAYEMARNPISE